ncbi:hypothetical protein V9T40_003999 [Parthenolecanium corni]|uniref:Uncharacterized protein n=1 Tax=Parthenolecanium corni TaxID=536013 RepID=A0AAN9TG92_9HEMI
MKTELNMIPTICEKFNGKSISLLIFHLHPSVARAFQQTGFRRVKRGYKPLKVEVLVPGIKPAEDPTDPYFPLQWYLKNTGQNGGKVKLDLNVEAAWAQGITGKNVTTAIMDDGLITAKDEKTPTQPATLEKQVFTNASLSYIHHSVGGVSAPGPSFGSYISDTEKNEFNINFHQNKKNDNFDA